jgi:hypothetical protein
MQYHSLRLQWAALLLTMATLASCAMSKSAPFTNTSPDALIVFATSSDRAEIIGFDFASFDPSTKRVTATSFRGHGYREHYWGSKVQYNVLRVSAGHYVLSSLEVGGHTRVVLSEGTVCFEVKPGQIAYLGAFNFNGSTAVRTEGDPGAARAHLREYSNVTGDMAPVEMSYTEINQGD